VAHSRGTFAWHIRVAHSRGTFTWHIRVAHSRGTFAWHIHVAHSRGTFTWHIRVAHSRGTFAWHIRVALEGGTFAWHSKAALGGWVAQSQRMMGGEQWAKVLEISATVKGFFFYKIADRVGSTFTSDTHENELVIIALLISTIFMVQYIEMNITELIEGGGGGGCYERYGRRLLSSELSSRQSSSGSVNSSQSSWGTTSLRSRGGRCVWGCANHSRRGGVSPPRTICHQPATFAGVEANHRTVKFQHFVRHRGSTRGACRASWGVGAGVSAERGTMMVHLRQRFSDILFDHPALV
jgi:hypothetical protein